MMNACNEFDDRRNDRLEFACTADSDDGMTSETTIVREVTVNLENGLHMVPCSRIAEQVRDYSGSVNFHLGDHTVDAKSIFDLLTLKASAGTVLTLEVSGSDSEGVVDRLVKLFERDFELG